MIKSLRASDVIGDRVKDLRNRRGLTREQLSERCAAIGAEISPAVLVNIETGRPDKTTGKRRRDVTVEEVLVLARALDAPPALLFIPFDGRTRLQITPDLEMPSGEALFWVSGESEPSAPEQRQRWREVSGPVRQHRAFFTYFNAAARFESVDRDAFDSRARELSQVINSMVMQGITPPAIPAEWLDRMRSEGWLEHPEEVPMQTRDEDDGSRSRSLVR